MDLPNFKYFYNNKAKTLDVVLHGSSAGIDSDFIKKIMEASRKIGNCVVSFDFPYFERGDEHSSGPELIEEIEALKLVLNNCQSEKFESIRLIGKSLGAVIAGHYLKQIDSEKFKKYSVVVFGYDIGYIDLKSFSGKITIIQGSRDKFGDIDAVKKDLNGCVSKNVVYLTIEGADHSYRVPETKEPIYEEDAINLFLKL